VARPGDLLCASIIAAGLVVAPLARAAAVEAPRSFSADYLITWLGIPVYETRFTAAVRRHSYRAVMSARSRGIVELVSRIRVHFETVGRIVADSFRPRTVRQIYLLKNGKFRHVDLDYRRDGDVVAAIRPPESPGKRKPVPAALRRDTQDPISALLGAVTMALTAKPCMHTAAVFEGRRRVDTRLSYSGLVDTPLLAVDGLPEKAELCRLHAKRIAGFRPRHFRKMPTLPAAQLWVVRHRRAGIWLPVQLRLDTRWGPIYARITRFKLGTAPQ
jgi:hypothetical protein